MLIDLFPLPSHASLIVPLLHLGLQVRNQYEGTGNLVRIAAYRAARVGVESPVHIGAVGDRVSGTGKQHRGTPVP